MAANPNFDTIASTTIHNYQKKLEDNVFTSMPVLYYIRMKGGATEQGGTKIVMPLMYGKNDTIDWLDKYGIIATHAIEGISAAEYPWAHLAGSIVVSNIEIEVENTSDEQIINLLKAKMNQAELSIKDKVYTQLWASRSLARQMWGIPDLVTGVAGTAMAVDPAFGDYGNIDRAGTSSTFWRNVNNDVTGATVLTLAMLNDAYLDLADGTDQPDLIICNQALYQKYESLLQAQYRYSDERLGQAGIENLKHKNAVIVLDKSCTAATIYLLNTKYIQFITAKGRNFKIGSFQEPEDQDVRVAKILWSGNLGCSNCQRQGKIIAVTAV